ncbi:hypothetical protein TRFO_34494 [Tritrichomonas foetus]|uniref:Uncharacterized protein n=1 Tax=Tritrichomonas foetus TaxID=1144522 RepID=A0A1J4JNP7_9EUKA|nr:hypothetical protein TRFO_34494 [Tritrichomonas foetus]|eukprot:OHS99139.1 hypothetical protein TRFO_34494 [Tritrichomonas foetus]
MQSSRSVLQLYYSDHAFTNSLCTICQEAIASIPNDENDTNYNQLFNYLQDYWVTDHNIAALLTVPASIGSDKPLNNIALFLNYIPFVSINETTQPKTSGSKTSFIDRISADWTNPRVRIAFRTAIDIIYAIFSTLILKNYKQLTEDEAEKAMHQYTNYLNLENQNPEIGKFRIISARYFAKAVSVISDNCPSFIFGLFINSLYSEIRNVKKTTDSDQRYLLNINLCLYSNLMTEKPFDLETKKVDETFQSLFSVISKSSKYDGTLQKDTCLCLLNFFGVVLSVKLDLCESSLLNNTSKLVHHHSKKVPVFLSLRTLLFCFDNGKHSSMKAKDKFFNKVLNRKTNQGDVLNVFTYFLRGPHYEPRYEIDDITSSFTWIPDQYVTEEIKKKMTDFILSDPKLFIPYQEELSDFLIQYATIDTENFVNKTLPKLIDIGYFQDNAMAVLRVGKIMLTHGTKFVITPEQRSKVNQMFNDIVYLIMQNVLTGDRSAMVFHVAPFYPIFTNHDSDYTTAVKYIDQCSNPLSFRNVINLETPRTIKSKWYPCLGDAKTPILEPTECPLNIYSGVSSTDMTLMRVMTIIPHFQVNSLLITRVISLIYSSLTDISAFAIRLLQTFFIATKDRSSLFPQIIQQISQTIKITNENLYMLLYTVHGLLDSAINLRYSLDESIETDLNYAIIIGLCTQNIGVHDIALSLADLTHQMFSTNSIKSILNKYQKAIASHAKRAALLTATETDVKDIVDVDFRDIAHTNLARLYHYYIASFANCLSKEHSVLTKDLYHRIMETVYSFEASRCPSYLFTSLVIFLTNSYTKAMKCNKQKIDTIIQDPRIEEWTGFALFSAVAEEKKHEFFLTRPNSSVAIQAISLGVRVATTDSLDEGTAKKYIEYMSSIVKYFKKIKLIHSKLSFSFSTALFMQHSNVIRIVFDTIASLFKIFYDKYKKVPPGPYLRKEVMQKNISDYFDVESWYCFILNFCAHKNKKSIVSSSKDKNKDKSKSKGSKENDKERVKEIDTNKNKDKDSSDKSNSIGNSVRNAALNALYSLLTVAMPPESINNKFLKNISKYDDSTLSLVLSYFIEQLLPTFISKALSSYHSTRYFHAIVNQFSGVQNNFIDVWMANAAGTMSPADVRFADAMFANTGTIIALAFIKITKKSDTARSQAFSLLLNVSVGAAAYLNKPDSAARICEKMQSLRFTITSQLTNLYMSALLSISSLLSQELNIVSEQLIATVLDNLAMGGNSILLASILAPWIKAPKFDDDTPIVFTATQPQFACFTRFSFAKSFSRIVLTQSLTFVIDALLTTNGAASFLTVALFSLYQSDPESYSNVTSTLSYIIQQRPSECASIITSIFEFPTWFYYNIELISISKNKPNPKSTDPKAYRQSMIAHRSISDSMLANNRNNSESNLLQDQSISDYKKAIQFALDTICATNLDIYKGYQHRLFAFALITMAPDSDNNMIKFLLPKVTSPEDIESKIAKTLRSQGDLFAQQFGKECLTWGLCCGELRYAIQALSLYRKILSPIDPEIINKLIDCIRLASIAINESPKLTNIELIVSYIANCFETIRVLAEKNNLHSLALFKLCYEYLLMKDPEIQTVLFNFMAFLINDQKLAQEIRTLDVNIIRDIHYPFDDDSCAAFVKLLLAIAKVGLFELIGSPILTSILILLILPLTTTRGVDLSFFSALSTKFKDFALVNKLTELSLISNMEDEAITEGVFYLAKHLKDDELTKIGKILALVLKSSYSNVNSANIYKFVIEYMSSNDCNVNAFARIFAIDRCHPNNEYLMITMKEIFEKNNGVASPSPRSSIVTRVPKCQNFTFPSEFDSSNDFSSISKLPPIYFIDSKSCSTNQSVLKAISKIRAQPLNDWSELMFRAESTRTQVEVLKSRKSNQQHNFESGLFLTNLKKIFSQNLVEENENENESSSHAKSNVEIIEKIDSSSFMLHTDEINELWKDSINTNGNNYDILKSIMI